MNYIELADDLMSYVGPQFYLEHIAIKYPNTASERDLTHACIDVTLIPYARLNTPVQDLMALDMKFAFSLFWVKMGPTIWDLTQEKQHSANWTTDDRCVRPGRFAWHRTAATFMLRRANGVVNVQR